MLRSCLPIIFSFRPGYRIHHPGVHSRMLLWCLEGGGEVWVNGIPLSLTPRSFLLLPWGHAIRYRIGTRLFTWGACILSPTMRSINRWCLKWLMRGSIRWRDRKLAAGCRVAGVGRRARGGHDVGARVVPVGGICRGMVSARRKMQEQEARLLGSLLLSGRSVITCGQPLPGYRRSRSVFIACSSMCTRTWRHTSP